MKIAIILFNLGGPDSLEAVQPFLRNLFSDPAIITLPTWLRLPLARFIAHRRTPKARGIYEKIGGGSPIVTTTDGQANAIVWAVGAGGDNRLRGFRGDTGAVVFSGGASGDAMGMVRRFQTLVAVGERLYVVGDGQVYAFAF